MAVNVKWEGEKEESRGGEGSTSLLGRVVVGALACHDAQDGGLRPLKPGRALRCGPSSERPEHIGLADELLLVALVRRFHTQLRARAEEDHAQRVHGA